MSKYLVTGAMGCLGSWTLYHLVKAGKDAVSFDLSTSRHRLDMLLPKDEQEAITFIQGDLTDTDAVARVFADHSITHVIHMAALQVPFCRKDPVMGSRVNVTGTINVFEAARHHDVGHVTYASSVAVFGGREHYADGLLSDDVPRLPATLYGVYKVANEDSAKVYYQDYGVTSTALRPYTVYGVARDQGMTSEPTKAMLAAANGEDFAISFGGTMQFHYASDVAQQFIHAAENPLDGAYAFSLGSQPVAVTEVAAMIGDITGKTVTV
ncbi:MAG: NAD-dependent epimerase/dehydratase family protein, partial [Chloroflexota bacterium]